MSDDFGDRMKGYEAVEAKRRLTGGPVCARIDGRSFSKFTRDFEKPYDQELAGAMRFACRKLVEDTKANIGYVQSDEISLVWDVPDEGSQMIFDARTQKLTSVLASMATAAFCVSLSHFRPDAVQAKLPHFDARVWTVPSRTEAANVILWRSQDARKNGISSAARSCMSAKQMHGLDQMGMLAAMLDRGIEYHTAFPRHHKWGTFYKRVTTDRVLDEDEWYAIPEKHRPAQGTLVTRSEVVPLDINYFGGMSNREEIIFEDARPNSA